MKKNLTKEQADEINKDFDGNNVKWTRGITNKYEALFIALTENNRLMDKTEAIKEYCQLDLKKSAYEERACYQKVSDIEYPENFDGYVNKELGGKILNLFYDYENKSSDFADEVITTLKAVLLLSIRNTYQTGVEDSVKEIPKKW